MFQFIFLFFLELLAMGNTQATQVTQSTKMKPEYCQTQCTAERCRSMSTYAVCYEKCDKTAIKACIDQKPKINSVADANDNGTHMYIKTMEYEFKNFPDSRYYFDPDYKIPPKSYAIKSVRLTIGMLKANCKNLISQLKPNTALENEELKRETEPLLKDIEKFAKQTEDTVAERKTMYITGKNNALAFGRLIKKCYATAEGRKFQYTKDAVPIIGKIKSKVSCSLSCRKDTCSKNSVDFKKCISSCKPEDMKKCIEEAKVCPITGRQIHTSAGLVCSSTYNIAFAD